MTAEEFETNHIDSSRYDMERFEFAEAYHKAKSEEQTTKIDQLIEDYERRQRTVQKMLEKTSNDEKKKERLLTKSGVYRHVISELKKLKGCG